MLRLHHGAGQEAQAGTTTSELGSCFDGVSDGTDSKNMMRFRACIVAVHTVESGQFAGCSLGPEEACWILRTAGWELKRASIAYKWPLHRVRGGAVSQNSLNAMF